MSKKGTIGAAIGLLVILVLVAPATLAAGPDGTSPGTNLVLINFVGQEGFVEVDGTSYTIAGTDTVPNGGKLEFALANGKHTFGVSIPGVGADGREIDVSGGEMFVFGVKLDRKPAVIENNVVLKKPYDVVQLFEASLNPPAAPVEAAAPETNATVPPAGKGALFLVNFTGEQMHIDLEGTGYALPGTDTHPGGGWLQINLTPGKHAFTASLPRAAVNVDVEIVEGMIEGRSFVTNIIDEQKYEEKYEEGEPKPTPQALYITVNAITVNPPAPASEVADGAPGVMPVTGGESSADDEADPYKAYLVIQ